MVPCAAAMRFPTSASRRYGVSKRAITIVKVKISGLLHQYFGALAITPLNSDAYRCMGVILAGDAGEDFTANTINPAAYVKVCDWDHSPIRLVQANARSFCAVTTYVVGIATARSTSRCIVPASVSPNILKSASSDHSGYLKVAGLLPWKTKCPSHAKP